MDAHGVDVFNETDGDHLVFSIPDDLQFQLLPTQNRLLNQYLADKAGADTAAGYETQFFHVINETATGPAHSIGGTDNHRVAELCRHLFGVLNAIYGGALRHLYTQFIHRFFESYPVLAALNGIHVDTYYLDPVFFKHTGTCQF